MESNRQKKIAGLLQQDLTEVLQGMVRKSGHSGIIVSVTKAWVSPDLSLAKAWVSIYPIGHVKGLLSEMERQKKTIRYEVAQRTKHQLRRMPELNFFHDDSLDYAEGIDRALAGGDNPMET